MKTLLTLLFATVLTGVLAVTNVHPAQADQAAVRRNILIGAAALFAGIAIETNVAHKRQLANTVQGYLPNGGTVYRDGRVVLPDGQSYYPGKYGQTIACNSGSCYISGGQNYNGYNNSYQPYGNLPSNGSNQYYNGYDPSANTYNPTNNYSGVDYNQAAYSNSSYQNSGQQYRRRRNGNHS